MKELTEEWIRKAEKDYLVAVREFNAIPPEYDAVCFHFQQCVEKYLKAILQENEVFFEKTHDLDVLAEKCRVFLPEISDFKIILIELLSFAVEVRYPGKEATEEDAKDFLLAVEKIRKIIRQYFELS